MCVIHYNTCETGHIESSVLLSLSASCYNDVTESKGFKSNPLIIQNHTETITHMENTPKQLEVNLNLTLCTIDVTHVSWFDCLHKAVTYLV